MRNCILALLSICGVSVLCLGQGTTEPLRPQSIQVIHATSPQQFQELATILRLIVGAASVSSERAPSLEFSGTPDQLLLAIWLFRFVDLESPTEDRTPHRYKLAGKDDVTSVIRLPAKTTPQEMQQSISAIRSTADLQRIYVYNTAKAICMRASEAQIALAEFLLEQDGKAADASFAYTTDTRGSTAVRVFHPRSQLSPMEVQEMITSMRSIADIQRIFAYGSPLSIALRSTPECVAAAEWIFHELDGVGRPEPHTAAYDQAFPGDQVVRIFYLPSATNRDLQQIMTNIRVKTGIQRLFAYNSRHAVLVRGTHAQVTQAEQMLQF